MANARTAYRETDVQGSSAVRLESFMPSDATARLRIVNADLRAGLAQLQPEAIALIDLTAQNLSKLLKTVALAAECRRSLAWNEVPDNELEREFREYRSNMEELAKALPAAHGYLLAVKARLQNAQSHVAAANAWAQANKNTL
jgi:hypothetical protein